ncbi:MAG: glycosyltransferase family 1 protein [bacterium]
MKIGIDARFYGPIGGGGLGRYTKELVDNLEQIDRTNQYVIFLCRENWDDYNPAHQNFRKVLAPYKWYSWREQIFMPFKIWREKVDSMHFPHFNTPLIYVLFTRINANKKANRREFFKGGFILTVHDLILLKYPSKKATTLAPIYFKLKFWVYKIVIRVALRRAGKIIVPSNFVKNDIIKYFNVFNEKIEVIYEGVTDVDKENGFRENRIMNHELGIREIKKLEIRNWKLGEGDEGIKYEEIEDVKEGDKKNKIWYNENKKLEIRNWKLEIKPYILYVGNAYPHKNLERLVGAFSLLIRKEGGDGREGKEGEEGKLEIRNLKLEIRNWKLVLVGVRNYFYERLEEYVKDNFPDIKDRIIFLGYATDKELAQLYKNAALYVFPSLEEGFGLPPLEAMSYGVPVISSDKSCLSEILSNAVLYFDAENSEDMADKILCGLEDEKRRKDLIKKGYERIQLYDWEKNARKTMEVYGEV